MTLLYKPSVFETTKNDDNNIPVIAIITADHKIVIQQCFASYPFLCFFPEIVFAVFPFRYDTF